MSKLIELTRPQRWLQPPWGMSQDWSLTMDNSKTCARCGQTKLLSDFGRDQRYQDGLRRYCKACNNTQASDYYAKNKAEINLKSSIRFARQMQENPEVLRKQSASRQRAFRCNNPKSATQNYQKWLSQNPGANYQATKKWRSNNPAKVSEHGAKRRARKAGAVTFLVTDKDIHKLLSQPCIYCGAKAEHLDHVIPLSRGGNHSIGNLAPSCAKCNTSKNAKFITEWRKLWS